MYKDAARYFDRALLSITSPGVNATNFFLPYIFSYCVAYLGQFNRAIGVLDFNWRRYHKESEFGMAFLFRSALGIVLLMMGKRQSALFHLQGAMEGSQRHHSPQYILLTRMGLAYYHFLEGRMEESFQIMSQGMHEAVRDGYQVRQYTHPFVLEMAFEFQHRGKRFQPTTPSFDQEMERILNGPNIHLRGVAYRIRARGAFGHGDDLERIRSDLKSSERYLKRSGDPLELAKTRAQMARLELKAGNSVKATSLAASSWKRVSIFDGNFFPHELAPLLKEGHTETDGTDSQADVLRRFLDLMEEFIPSADLDELLRRVVATSAKFHGAERGGLFWFEKGKKDRAPMLRAKYNLSEDQVSTEEFRSSLGYIFKAFRTNQAIVFRSGRSTHEPGTKTRAILCLPFEVRGRVRGVLYHDNSYTDEGFEFLDRATLIRFARQMSTYIERIWEYSRLVKRKAILIQGPSTRIKGTDSPVIVGQNPAMRRLLDLVDQIADSSAPTLISGETGVGKELLALRLHQMSRRSSGSFVAVDLSAIPESLVESELFGHEKGAFTGADHQKPGRLELAHQGTLFIDEAGEIPLHLQTKLLRVLQEKSFVRIGGSRLLSSDFRLIAATNRDLEIEVGQGRFRKDLYYRLNVVPLKIPPLRERGDDVLLLARHFLHHFARKHNRLDIRLTAEVEAALKAYHWPGNVRELQNVIERGILLAENDSLDLTLPEGPESLSNQPFADTPTMDELQKRYIRFILEKTGGRIGGPDGTAAVLGMKRTTLYTRMKRLGMT
jgi:transcriptional regulator with GAF, ATPase, and Fis domain